MILNRTFVVAYQKEIAIGPTNGIRRNINRNKEVGAGAVWSAYPYVCDMLNEDRFIIHSSHFHSNSAQL